MRIHQARAIWMDQMDDTDIDSQVPFHIWLSEFEQSTPVAGGLYDHGCAVADELSPHVQYSLAGPVSAIH
jgi:hypothetical protein